MKSDLPFKISKEKSLEKLHLVDQINPLSLTKLKNGKKDNLRSLKICKILDSRFLEQEILSTKTKRSSRRKKSLLKVCI